MLNKCPIFVNGFGRGGTNIIMNILASHPDVCMAAGETHEVFYGNKPITKWIRRSFYLPIWLTSRQHIFYPWWFGERSKPPHYIMSYIDALLYLSKFTVHENRFKAEGIHYSRAEIRNSRTLSKNINGTVLATPILAEMYPDATFIALVRNGLALCEGYLRRGDTPDYCGKMYELVCQQMIRDSDRLDNYHIVQFEDLISDHVSFVEKVYNYAGLDIAAVPMFRFEAKASMDRDGSRIYTVGSEHKKLYWFGIEELGFCFRRDVNDNQIAHLSTRDRNAFLSEAQLSMEYLGYI